MFPKLAFTDWVDRVLQKLYTYKKKKQLSFHLDMFLPLKNAHLSTMGTFFCLQASHCGEI